MRIAVTHENGCIFQHFGHSEEFKLYDIEDGKIINTQVISTNGSGHGALAGFLNGTLGYNPDVKCSHHKHEHGRGDHTCGLHGCGSQNCH